jgi:putative restriction endonuclease
LFRPGEDSYNPPVDESDLRVRLAAFAFLDEQRKLSLDLLERRVLQQGFDLDGQRVPLQAPQGIFKPRVCRFPLSITTVPVTEGRPRPYDDIFGADGLLRYRYRGTDPNHPDNAGLREAMRRGVPLVYFHGIVEGKYEAEYPVFIVGDDAASLTFTVSVDERRFASLGTVADDAETDIRRRYVTRAVRQRLHQQEFRERVLEAYQRHCAICRLKREQLLEAAHIVADAEELGAPVVPNGIALCALHHAAFDAHLIAVRPDYQIEIRRDVLEESDGPMLIHGLQGFHGQRIRLPAREGLRPRPSLLEARYELFRRAARN